jgi:hypothetical protein
VIAIPIQADAGLANMASAMTTAGVAGAQGEKGFAQALLSAVGGEVQPAEESAFISAEPNAIRPIHEDEQKSAEAGVAVNLAAPVIPAPLIDLENIPAPEIAVPTTGPASMPVADTGEGVHRLLTAHREEPAAGDGKPALPQPSEFPAAAPAPASASASAPGRESQEMSPAPETSVPPLTAATQPSAGPRQPLELSAEPFDSGKPDEGAPQAGCTIAVADADAGDPPPPETEPTETAPACKLALEDQSGTDSVPTSGNAGDMSAAIAIKAQAVPPAPRISGTLRPFVAMAAAVTARPELHKPGEANQRNPWVERVSPAAVAADHPARELWLPMASLGATILPTSGQTADKPRVSGGEEEPHQAHLSSSPGPAETPPAGPVAKAPETGSSQGPAMALPSAAVANVHGSQSASAHDGGTLSVPASVPANQSVADSSAASPAMKSRPPLPADPAAGPLFGVTGTVNAARIVDRVGQSEMHIGLRTLAFGSVEVHTVVRDSQVGLTVGSEKGDLRTFLAPEVPSLQTALHQHDLHFDNIRFLDQGPGFDMGFSTGADSQSHSFAREGRPVPGLPGLEGPAADSSEVEIARDTRTGLNVHA